MSLLLGGVVVGVLSGCVGLATNAAANALSGTGTIFSGDDDPEFIADAAPFGLKSMEAVLEQTPEHEGLLLALASGYTQYGYAFLQEEADRVREDDYERALEFEGRALKHYRRALSYGFRGLATRHDHFEEHLRSEPGALREELKKEDVPYLYWTAAAWALEIRASQYAPAEIADFPLVLKLVQWGLSLDDSWDNGALHALMITIESSRPGGSVDTAEAHFQRALELDQGRRAGTYVTMAENVCVLRQDVECFRKNLALALAVDVQALPGERLVTVLMQRRAKRLQLMEEDLFLMDDADE
ncbi:MAG: TRAP transporter TatT component family protein [Myxococcales bacterium]|nr:TRAP transporter TatT component family protein [Myxococcales bacterium]